MNSKLHIESKWQEARVMESEFQVPPTFSEMCLNASIAFNKSKKIVNDNSQLFHVNLCKITFIYHLQQKGHGLWKVKTIIFIITSTELILQALTTQRFKICA